MANIINIINTILANVKYFRTIEQIWVDKETICAGNNAVTARCRVMGREGKWLIKCYYRHKPNLKEIYGDALYENELGLYSIDGHMEYIDILLMPWVEGRPLDELIGNQNSDYAKLSKSFDKLALDMLGSEYAHGDIKPDNIIVDDELNMRFIDLDAMWRPDLKDYISTEIGTFAFRHPRRNHNYYKKAIDDYPLALISTTLAALASDRRLEEKLNSDKMLFYPCDCVYDTNETLDSVISLFERNKDTAHKSIAESLRSVSPIIHGLHKMFYIAVNGNTKGYQRPKHEIEFDITPQQQSKARSAANGHNIANIGNGSRWTPDDDMLLAILLFDNNRISSIARYMKRSEQAIRRRANMLHLPINELNRRKPVKQYTTAMKTNKEREL